MNSCFSAIGGTLLYLGGPDAYLDIDDAWWNEDGKGGSPTANLLMHLGLDGNIEAKTLSGGVKALRWMGGETDADVSDYRDGALKAGGDAYTYYYDGNGFDTLLQTEDGKSVGISAKAGKGQLIMVGLSTTDYSDSAAAADLMRMLVAKATETTDYDSPEVVEKLFRDARIFSLMEGTNEIQRMSIGMGLLGKMK